MLALIILQSININTKVEKANVYEAQINNKHTHTSYVLVFPTLASLAHKGVIIFCISIVIFVL